MTTRKLAAFLQTAKEAVANPSLDKIVHVVMGNQASDADSIISAVCHAYLEQESKNSSNIVYVPVASIARAEIHFRREVKLLLQLIDLTLDDLVCIEEVPVGEIKHAGNLEVSLTDHNALDPKFEDLMSSSVKSIIDHHTDCGLYPWVTGLRRNIAFDMSCGKPHVGSACTLVAENFLQIDCHEGGIINEDIAILLMAVIVLDTINMDEVAGIGTIRDHAAIRSLERVVLNAGVADRPATLSKDALFTLLRDAKLDPAFWEELSTADALKMDYKHFSTQLAPGYGVGVASVLQPLKQFIQKEDLKDAILCTMQAQNLNALVVMSFVHLPSPAREILLMSFSRKYIEDITAFLCRDGNIKFQLRPMDDVNSLRTMLGPELYWVAFNQGAVRASRKQVAPELQLFENSSSST